MIVMIIFSGEIDIGYKVVVGTMKEGGSTDISDYNY